MYGCVVNKPTNFWGLSLSFNAASLVDCSQDVPLSVMGYHLLRNVLLSFDREQKLKRRGCRRRSGCCDGDRISSPFVIKKWWDPLGLSSFSSDRPLSSSASATAAGAPFSPTFTLAKQIFCCEVTTGGIHDAHLRFSIKSFPRMILYSLRW